MGNLSWNGTYGLRYLQFQRMFCVISTTVQFGLNLVESSKAVNATISDRSRRQQVCLGLKALNTRCTGISSGLGFNKSNLLASDSL